MKNTYNWDLHCDLILTKSARVLRKTQRDVLSKCWQLWGCRDGLWGESQGLSCQLQQTLSRTQLSLAAKCDPWQSRQTDSRRSSTPVKNPHWSRKKVWRRKGAERETAKYQLPHLHVLLVRVEELEVKDWSLEKGRKSVVLMFVFLFLTIWTYSSWQFPPSWICLACDSNW